LAVSQGEASPKSKLEVREKTQQEKDREHIQKGLRVRNKDIEREYPDVAAQGEVIARAGIAVLEKIGTPEVKPTPPLPVPRQQEAPLATGYAAELGRMKAKQDELRAQGKTKEADAYNEGIKKYEDWKSQQKPATPKISPVPGAAPKKVDSIESIRPVPAVKPSEEVSIAEALDAQVAPVKSEPAPEAPKIPAPKPEVSPKDVVNIKLTPKQREKLQEASEQGLKREQDLLMRPREQAPAEREAPIERELDEEELPENPSERILALRRAQERGGGFADTIKSAVEWASRKTGAGVWLETLMPRAKSVYHRQFAERRAYHQEKAQGSLERAQGKFEEFKLKTADALWPDKKYYAWRMRVWEKAVAKREGLVNKYDGYRKRRIERHNELQAQVADRYDRELAPYKGKFEALKREEDLVKSVMAALEADQKKALAALAIAESKRKGLFGRRGAAAAATIKRESDEIARRLNVQREFLKKIQKPLASASAKIEKYETKRKQAVATTKFLEMDNLKGVSRKRAVVPKRESSVRYIAEESSERSFEVDGERENETWGVKEFVDRWNTNGSENLIRDVKEFEEFVQNSRAGAGETGPLHLGELFRFTQEYVRTRGKAKKFAQDKRYFLARVPKKNF
jgi:hypothetical protein